MDDVAPRDVAPRIDIRELARRSGVSVATVSRALNDRPDVSPRTRDRVMAIAREIGYQPNEQARSLVRRRSDLVGLVWDVGYAASGANHPFLADVLVGLKIALTGSGYHVLLVAAPGGRLDDDQAFVRAARQHSLEGAILMGVDEQSAAVAGLLASGRPCVGIDLPLAGSGASYVTSDNRAGAASAVAHLHALGHRRIATITGPMHLMPAIERLSGYRYQCERSGLDHRPDYVEHGDFFLDSGHACMRRLLALPSPPTAVFVAGDEMAVGALHAAAEAGVRVPEDVSVVGFDDIEIAALIRPALTTVAQDRAGLAAAAVDNLRALIATADAPAPGTAVAGPGPGGAAGLGAGGAGPGLGGVSGPGAGGGARAGRVTPRLLPTTLVVRDTTARLRRPDAALLPAPPCFRFRPASGSALLPVPPCFGPVGA